MRTKHAGWVSVIACVLFPAAAVGIVLHAAPRVPDAGVRSATELARSALCAAGVIEWIALAVLVPMWRRTDGLWGTCLRIGLWCASGFLTMIAFSEGRLVPQGAGALHIYLACFGFALAGIGGLAAAVIGTGRGGQVAATLAAAGIASTVLVADFAVAIWPAAREAVAAIVLGTNPIAVAGSALDCDVMRAAKMYTVCFIGTHTFRYPSWQLVAGLHLAVGIVFAALAELLARFAGGEGNRERQS